MYHILIIGQFATAVVQRINLAKKNQDEWSCLKKHIYRVRKNMNCGLQSSVCWIFINDTYIYEVLELLAAIQHDVYYKNGGCSSVVHLLY